MSTYVMSDLHGQYELYSEMLKKIEFDSGVDVLYVLGDILDRGPGSLKLLQKIKDSERVYALAGNHEAMALECMRFLLKEITEETISRLDETLINKLLRWQHNGGGQTMAELTEMDAQQRKNIIAYIENMDLYKLIQVNGERYILVHAGLGNFEKGRPLEEYTLWELVWSRSSYDRVLFEDAYVISGHMPTQAICDNPRPGYIYSKNRNIVIDCGACFPQGRLGCLRLEDMKEFYIENSL